MKEGIAAHVAELKGHADLGTKPKSVQPTHGEVYRVTEQNGENPALKHADALQQQAILRGEQDPLQPNPAEQQSRERLSKPPPAESPVQNQGEVQAGEHKLTDKSGEMDIPESVRNNYFYGGFIFYTPPIPPHLRVLNAGSVGTKAGLVKYTLISSNGFQLPP
jgi:hypothetical protein